MDHSDVVERIANEYTDILNMIRRRYYEKDSCI